MASLYAGCSLALPTLDPEVERVPKLEGVSGALETALWVVGLCCVNESISTAYLTECLAQTQHEVPRSSLRALLADEIDHARLGWGYLETLDADTCRELNLRLEWIVRTTTRTWIGSLREWPTEACPSHGLLARHDVASLVCELMRDLVLPGFERAGLDVATATHWFNAEGARWLLAGG